MRIWLIPTTRIMSIEISIIGWSGVEIVDIIDLFMIVLGKRTPNLAIYSQMANQAINFT